LEEFAGAVAEFTKGMGDFLVASPAQEVDCGIPKNGQILWPMPGFHLAFVLAERHIANPMQTIFDAPVTSPIPQQKRRIRLFSRKAGDGVLDFNLWRMAFAFGRAFKTANLTQAGPIEMSGQSRAGLQMSLNNPPVPLGNVA
jgi:hypothetical protein